MSNNSDQQQKEQHKPHQSGKQQVAEQQRSPTRFRSSGGSFESVDVFEYEPIGFMSRGRW